MVATRRSRSSKLRGSFDNSGGGFGCRYQSPGHCESIPIAPTVQAVGASLRFMQTAPATCNDCLQVAPQRHNISAGTRHKADRQLVARVMRLAALVVASNALALVLHPNHLASIPTHLRNLSATRPLLSGHRVYMRGYACHPVALSQSVATQSFSAPTIAPQICAVAMRGVSAFCGRDGR